MGFWFGARKGWIWGCVVGYGAGIGLLTWQVAREMPALLFAVGFVAGFATAFWWVWREFHT